MKRSMALLLGCSCLALLSGCALKEKYAANNSAADRWLAGAGQSPAQVNFEGVYYSPDWGMAVLNQKNGEIAGTLSYFTLKGVVRGRVASLVLVDDSWVEHTMVLKRRDNEVLEGSVSPSIPYSSSDSKKVIFERIVR